MEITIYIYSLNIRMELVRIHILNIPMILPRKPATKLNIFDQLSYFLIFFIFIKHIHTLIVF